MKMACRRLVPAALLFVVVAASCRTAPAPGDGSGPRVVRPGTPGAPTRVLDAAEAVRPDLPHTEADVRFMRDMIVHHRQALEMSRLIPERSRRPEILLLGQRIIVSQEDEIALMREWLERRGEAVPEDDDGHGHHGADPGRDGGGRHVPDAARDHARDGAAEHAHHHGADAHRLMPGMLTPQQMARLAAVSGAEFDRLFLAAMIQHHEGALIMVAELFASPGAAQEEEIFQFASHVEADQSIEIARMHRMLRAMLDADR